DVQPQAQLVAPALFDLDHHCVGIFDDGPRQVVEHVARSRPDAPGAVVDLVVVDLVVIDPVVFDLRVGHDDAPGALNWSHAPEIFNSFSTASVGCAPLSSQPTALSLSILTTDGSARGS